MNNRQAKQRVVEMLKTSFTQSDASFLVNCKGLTVAELTDLRKQLRGKKSRLQVAKVTLIKRALQDSESLSQVVPMVSDQVAVVFAEQDSPAVAKVLCNFAAKHEKMRLVGGYFESAVLDSRELKVIGSLPSREVLLAQLCGVLKAPIAKCAYVLKAIAEKKGAGSQAESDVAQTA